MPVQELRCCARARADSDFLRKWIPHERIRVQIVFLDDATDLHGSDFGCFDQVEMERFLHNLDCH